MDSEIALNPERAITDQRRWGFALASMCKPSLSRQPIQWSAGFHCYDGKVHFDTLFNFHIAYVDLAIGRRRQAKRRSTEFLVEDAGHPHRASDHEIYEMMLGWSSMTLAADADFDLDCPYRSAFSRRVLDSQVGRENDPYKIDLGIWGDHLLHLPPRFVGTF